MNVKHIVFPLDYSEACRRAAPHVEAAARSFDARVSLVHVLGLFPPHVHDSFHFLSDSEIQVLLHRERDTLSSFAREVFSKELIESPGRVNPVTHLEGEPATKIVRYATEHNADLIMMPTHGLRTFRRLLIGSTTAKVLHDTLMPVWTSIHGSATNDSGKKVLSERILCAIDLGPCSMRVLQTAQSLADRLKAKWCVLHAVTAAGPHERDARIEAMRLLNEAGISVPLCVAHGNPANAIRQHASETSSDLIVIGRGCMTEHWGRLRTNVYAIIRESPCPVLSV
jgi:nucleotide-binding universal stress UspA family protein